MILLASDWAGWPKASAEGVHRSRDGDANLRTNSCSPPGKVGPHL